MSRLVDCIWAVIVEELGGEGAIDEIIKRLKDENYYKHPSQYTRLKKRLKKGYKERWVEDKDLCNELLNKFKENDNGSKIKI